MEGKTSGRVEKGTDGWRHGRGGLSIENTPGAKRTMLRAEGRQGDAFYFKT